MAEHLLQAGPDLRIVPASAAHLAVVTGERGELAVQHFADLHDRRYLFVGPGEPLEGFLLAQVVLARRGRVAGAATLLLHRRAHAGNSRARHDLMV